MAMTLLLPSGTGDCSDRATPNVNCFAVISMQWLCPCSFPQELAVCNYGQGERGGPPAAADGEERGVERAQELGAHRHDREVRRAAQGAQGKRRKRKKREGTKGYGEERKRNERERKEKGREII